MRRVQAIVLILLLVPGLARAGVIEDCVQSADRPLQIQACTEAIESGRWEGADLAWAYGNRANGWLSLGDTAKALEDYTAALDLDPDFALSWHNRGLVHAALGDYPSAIADYSAAIARDPEFAAAWGSRGVARREQGLLNEALIDLDRAIALAPETARHYQNRANVRCALGVINGAVEDRVAAIRLGYFPAELVQRVLKDKGYYDGEVSGDFDDASIEALRRWTAAGCK